MNLKKRPIFSTLALSVCLAAPAYAQVPVVDAAGSNSPGDNQQNQQRPAQNPGNELIMSLYMQLEQLQSEMQTLRGMVEEQGYRIERMEQEQRDRYLDLDRRLSNLTTGGGAGISTGLLSPEESRAAADAAAADNEQRGDSGGTAANQEQAFAVEPSPENEQEVYRSALNLLLEESRYEDSVNLFQQYIDNYPNGRYLTNAYYWQGEALILLGRYQEAEAAFRKVVEDYPDDPKAAGALLKMGVAHNQLGDRQQARDIWESIRSRYPESLTEIRAAQDYLNRLGNTQ